jgi:hypothetical protein
MAEIRATSHGPKKLRQKIDVTPCLSEVETQKNLRAPRGLAREGQGKGNATSFQRRERTADFPDLRTDGVAGFSLRDLGFPLAVDSSNENATIEVLLRPSTLLSTPSNWRSASSQIS